jgi:hypothetical protein
VNKLQHKRQAPSNSSRMQMWIKTVFWTDTIDKV